MPEIKLRERTPEEKDIYYMKIITEGCKDWKPKFHSRQYCELGNPIVKFACSDCIHLKFTEPTQKEMDSIPTHERQDLRPSLDNKAISEEKP